ncbi:imidazolonepropionase-like domain-containing protein [Streptomyces incanus]|uniref:Aminodeoxyfutalosine deaminase/Imidazolonepropionase-like composite domain-containing protein n=1 Tax=Streptomyces incanus TaxID=887453 RepID=A0ABW0Y014_9ACTN
MPTLHAADLLVTGDLRPSVPQGAVLVDGRTVAAVGPYEELADAHPTARVRRWPGLLTPGFLNPYGPELLEHAYHPDPREADELGTEPLVGAALAALPMTDARWGASARRGVQRMLAHGTVAVAGELRRPAVVDAVRRAGLSVEPRPAGAAGRAAAGTCPGTVPEGSAAPDGGPGLDPLVGGRGLTEALVAPFPGPGAAATFAVFDVPDEAALSERGAATCVATVLSGRLVHRRR